MPHSLTKMWVHAIWSTKDRAPLLNAETRDIVIKHIYSKFEDVGSPARIINGTPDHLHALFLLNKDESISSVMKMIKGESSHWINQENIVDPKFSWQVGFAAFSVSESKLPDVEGYIRRQGEHHREMSYQEEYDKFLRKYALLENR